MPFCLAFELGGLIVLLIGAIDDKLILLLLRQLSGNENEEDAISENKGSASARIRLALRSGSTTLNFSEIKD
jgi:hypothetical protein